MGTPEAAAQPVGKAILVSVSYSPEAQEGAAPKRFELRATGDRIRIGRGKDNEVVIEQKGASSFHAELLRHDPGDGKAPELHVCDRSTNGTSYKATGASTVRLQKEVNTLLPENCVIIMPSKVKAAEADAVAANLRAHLTVQWTYSGGAMEAEAPATAKEEGAKAEAPPKAEAAATAEADKVQAAAAPNAEAAAPSAEAAAAAKEAAAADAAVEAVAAATAAVANSAATKAPQVGSSAPRRIPVAPPPVEVGGAKPMRIPVAPRPEEVEAAPTEKEKPEPEKQEDSWRQDESEKPDAWWQEKRERQESQWWLQDGEAPMELVEEKAPVKAAVQDRDELPAKTLLQAATCKPKGRAPAKAGAQDESKPQSHPGANEGQALPQSVVAVATEMATQVPEPMAGAAAEALLKAASTGAINPQDMKAQLGPFFASLQRDKDAEAANAAMAAAASAGHSLQPELDQLAAKPGAAPGRPPMSNSADAPAAARSWGKAPGLGEPEPPPAAPARNGPVTPQELSATSKPKSSAPSAMLARERLAAAETQPDGATDDGDKPEYADEMAKRRKEEVYRQANQAREANAWASAQAEYEVDPRSHARTEINEIKSAAVSKSAIMAKVPPASTGPAAEPTPAGPSPQEVQEAQDAMAAFAAAAVMQQQMAALGLAAQMPGLAPMLPGGVMAPMMAGMMSGLSPGMMMMPPFFGQALPTAAAPQLPTAPPLAAVPPPAPVPPVLPKKPSMPHVVAGQGARRPPIGAATRGPAFPAGARAPGANLPGGRAPGPNFPGGRAPGPGTVSKPPAPATTPKPHGPGTMPKPVPMTVPKPQGPGTVSKPTPMTTPKPGTVTAGPGTVSKPPAPMTTPKPAGPVGGGMPKPQPAVEAPAAAEASPPAPAAATPEPAPKGDPPRTEPASEPASGLTAEQDEKVEKFATRFSIDARLKTQLAEELAKRIPTLDEDLATLSGVLETARNPPGLLLVKIRELKDGTFRSGAGQQGSSTKGGGDDDDREKRGDDREHRGDDREHRGNSDADAGDEKDKTTRGGSNARAGDKWMMDEIEAFVRRFRLDDRIRARFVDTITRRERTFKEDIKRLGEVLESARNPAGLLTVKLNEMERDGDGDRRGSYGGDDRDRERDRDRGRGDDRRGYSGGGSNNVPLGSRGGDPRRRPNAPPPCRRDGRWELNSLSPGRKNDPRRSRSRGGHDRRHGGGSRSRRRSRSRRSPRRRSRSHSRRRRRSPSRRGGGGGGGGGGRRSSRSRSRRSRRRGYSNRRRSRSRTPRSRSPSHSRSAKKAKWEDAGAQVKRDEQPQERMEEKWDTSHQSQARNEQVQESGAGKEQEQSAQQPAPEPRQQESKWDVGPQGKMDQSQDQPQADSQTTVQPREESGWDEATDKGDNNLAEPQDDVAGVFDDY